MALVQRPRPPGLGSLLALTLVVALLALATAEANSGSLASFEAALAAAMRREASGNTPANGLPGQSLEDDGEGPQHSYILVALSLAISLTAILAALVLAIVAVAAAGGLHVPLLAALPTASSAVLVLQLLASSGAGPGVPAPLGDLARTLAWAAPPSADAALAVALGMLTVVWVSRRLAIKQVATEYSAPATGADRSGSAALPHGLTFGAWELRCAGLLGLPLAAPAAALLLRSTSLPWLGSAAALAVLFFLVHQSLAALNFVSEVVEDSRVVRTTLPETAGGAEIFVDRVCNQLRALPVSPPPPGCVALFGDWLSSPGWCVAPPVAAIREVEQREPVPGQRGAEGEMPAWNSGPTSWCTMEESMQQTRGELEDELQDRPLLSGSPTREDSVALPTGEEDVEMGSRPSKSRNGSSDLPPFLMRPSGVVLSHPLRVATVAAYEVKAGDLVAGVACIPWLDCAVPAGALRRLEELGGEVSLRAHPGQLSGSLTSGRFAACFDWGTRWPWRWPLELLLKVLLGVWTALPAQGPPIVALAHLLMFALTAVFALGVLAVRPYSHRHDNTALSAASVAAALVVGLRAAGEMPRATLMPVAVAAAVLAWVPCALALLASVALASATLGRLEAQGLHDRLLPRTIAGWGVLGRPAAAVLSRSNSGFSGCGVAPSFSDAALEGHAVEVILPGHRKAFAIVLPAIARPRVVQAQLLPPVAGRGGDPEALPPCSATGDRARLPVPPVLLFPSMRPALANTNAPDAAAATAPAAMSPLAALLAPGRPGRLIYAGPEQPEGGETWREAIRDFFGAQGVLLAEEAERLIEEHTSTSETVLVVIEVLPAFAAEFMDERHEPASSR